MSTRALHLIAVLLGLGLGADAAEPRQVQGSPLVENLSTRDTRLAGSIWSIVETAESEIVIGSNKLLRFDGSDWREIDTQGGYGFRALCVGQDGRVWVGGTGQLGYLVKTVGGDWQFVSLLAAARAAGLKDDEELWHVAVTTHGVVFVATQRVFVWKNDAFESWPLPALPRLFAYTVRGELLIHQPGVGILRMSASGPVLARAAAHLPDGLLLWIVAAGDAQPDGLAGLLVGTNDAAYRLNPERADRLEELSRVLAGQLPTCAVAIGPDTIAIGTYQRGVVIANTTDGRVRSIHDRRGGLADDRVNHLFADRRRRIWVGASLGLSWIEPNARATIFDARHGLADAPVARVIARDGQLFATTSRSIYRLADTAAAPARFDVLPPLNTFVWDVLTRDDELIASGFGGIWRHPLLAQNPSGDWQREHHVSADVFQMVSSGFLAGTLFFLEGHSLKALQRTPREWVPRTLVADLGDTPVSLIEDSGGDLWVSLMLGGVRRFRVVDDIDGLPLAVRPVQEFAVGRDLPAGTVRPRLSLVGTRVVAVTETAILSASDQAERVVFEPVAALDGWIGMTGASVGSEAWWLARRREAERVDAAALFHVRLADDRWQVAPIEAPGLGSIGVVTSLTAFSGRDGPSQLWLGGAGGLLRVEPASAPGPPRVSLRRIGADLARNTSATADAEPEVPSGTLAVRLFSPSAAAGEPVFFQTKLEGAEPDWSPPQRAAERSFVGLAPGRYVLQARAVDRWDRAGTPVAFRFIVPTPWFRSGVAIAGYTLLALALVAVFVAWRLRALHRQAEQLNSLVAERTRELAAANAAKTEFLESISHEIRNPLNGVLGLVAMLREAAPERRAQELAGSLHACTQAVARVFDDVLNFTKLEHGQIGVRERPFTLPEVIEEVVALHRVTARDRSGEIVVRYTGESRTGFVGDADKIESVLTNFVGNALKYAPGSPIELHVDIEGADEFGANVTFNVTDRGPGIPPEEQELIFGKFVRGARAKAQRISGIGLGLATCRALAELLGGHVGVESPPSNATQGSTFFLTLRLKFDRAVPASVAGIPAAALAPPFPTSVGRALIVEDQLYNQLVVRRIAEQLGYAPSVAQDGADALARAARERFDLVLLDWELPDLKGDAVARRLRAQPGGSDLLIIATTAHDQPEIRREGTAAGIDGFALKPFDAEAIARLISDARQRRTGGDGLDTRVFRLVSGDDPHDAEQAAALYVELLDNELEALRRTFAADDRGGVAQAAHRLKSHAGLVNAVDLRDAAERVQRRAADADAAALSHLVQDTLEHGAALRRQLQRRTLATGSAR